MAAHGVTGALLGLLLAGCTAINISGNDNLIDLDKTGTDVDTDTDIEQKKGPADAGPED